MVHGQGNGPNRWSLVRAGRIRGGPPHSEALDLYVVNKHRGVYRDTSFRVQPIGYNVFLSHRQVRFLVTRVDW
ncbi:hypothetical protein GCM10023205_59860 [Yinghuangia aomiensis]|uniref:Uncharacterized protein n=1 Tax=Yinghuangia aomiensis TaxID=676205 RepID=A0ABP9HZB3_9ACTN